MSIYSINFQKLIKRLLPPFLRKERMLAWLYALVKPIEQLHTDFIAWRETTNLELSFNGQTMVIERRLNLKYYSLDVFASPSNPTASGHIWIDNTGNQFPVNYIFTDSEAQPPVFVYSDAENKPPFYSYAQADYELQYDFIVMVPNTLTFNLAEMTALINKYRIAGKRFKIQPY